MSVILECISVIVKNSKIISDYPGGMDGFMNSIPGGHHCTDGEIMRIGFMHHDDTEKYVQFLESLGLIFVKDDKAIDVCVIDFYYGPWSDCDWLDSGEFFPEDYPNKRILYARLVGSKLKKVEELNNIAVPEVWTIDSEFSDNDYEPTILEDIDYIGKEGILDVYFDKKKGKKVYLGRPLIDE